MVESLLGSMEDPMAQAIWHICSRSIGRWPYETWLEPFKASIEPNRRVLAWKPLRRPCGSWKPSRVKSTPWPCDSDPRRACDAWRRLMFLQVTLRLGEGEGGV